jgi:hypothetical protein
MESHCHPGQVASCYRVVLHLMGFKALLDVRHVCCRLMKDKSLRKVLRKAPLIEDQGDTTGDTSTSFTDDDELQEKLERKYGIRP